MGLYSYEDFQKALTESGMQGQFSDADLRLAKQNPDAGMGLLTAKKDWGAATTEDGKLLANATANQIRSDYGGYSGGASGSGFILDDKAAPVYQSPYASQIGDSLNNLVNFPDFSYDPKTDPAAVSARKEYLREGERAVQNTLGQAAAMTGGLPSSYAVTSATQAGDYYNTQLADREGELYDKAYNRYLNQWNQEQALFNSLQNAENQSYGQYSDSRNFENTVGQQDKANALATWEIYGYATPEVAAILGVPEGATTASVDYQKASLALKGDKKDSGTDPGTDPGTNPDDYSGYDLNGKKLTNAQYTALQALQSGTYTADDFNAVLAVGAYTKEQLIAAGYKMEGSKGSPTTPQGSSLTWSQASAKFSDAGLDINKYAVTQSEFNSSSSMKKQYGTYGGYLASLVQKYAAGGSGKTSSTTAVQSAKNEAKRRIAQNGATGEDIADFLGDLVDVYHEITEAEAQQIMKELGLI